MEQVHKRKHLKKSSTSKDYIPRGECCVTTIRLYVNSTPLFLTNTESRPPNTHSSTSGVISERHDVTDTGDFSTRGTAEDAFCADADVQRQ